MIAGYRMARMAALIAPLALLTACGGWWGGEDAPPLPGERIPILESDRTLQGESDVQDRQVQLPTARSNASWAQAGGTPSHVPGHLELPRTLNQAWQADIGSGNSRNRRLLSQPVIADGRVFTIDSSGQVSAFNAANGNRQWRVSAVEREDRAGAIGGGIAFDSGVVYVTNGAGEVVALDASNGGRQWGYRTQTPSRAAPTVVGGRVFVVTMDNRLIALDAGSGERLWSHQGVAEQAGIMGTASPAVADRLVVAAYSSGEILGIRLENGQPAWADSLAPVRGTGALSGMAHIRGHPAIERGIVVAMSTAGRIIAIDQRSGARLWEREFGGIQTPWVAGDFVFIATNRGEVLALTLRDGRIRWATQLERFEDPENPIRPVVWHGPVLAGERLILASSHGELVEIDPRDGSEIRRQSVGRGVTVAPSVAGGTLYLLGDNGSLVAYR